MVVEIFNENGVAILLSYNYSIGLGMISQVGYLHEHPEIENGLLHKGVQTIDEDEFLQIVDIALSSTSNTDGSKPSSLCAAPHILTGLEPLGLAELRKRGFEGTPATFTDPRAAILNQVLGLSSSSRNTEGSATLLVGGSSLPPSVATALHNKTSLVEAILPLITKQLSNFLLTSVEQLDTTKPMAALGMDSMLAAAVRAWFYKAFEVDLPFMMLLSQTASIGDLGQAVAREVQGRVDKD